MRPICYTVRRGKMVERESIQAILGVDLAQLPATIEVLAVDAARKNGRQLSQSSSRQSQGADGLSAHSVR